MFISRRASQTPHGAPLKTTSIGGSFVSSISNSHELTWPFEPTTDSAGKYVIPTQWPKEKVQKDKQRSTKIHIKLKIE